MSFAQPKMHAAGGITWVNEEELKTGWVDISPHRWSPFDIHVMLHHFAAREPFTRRDTPAYSDSMKRLTEMGLLVWDEKEKLPVATPLGEALVNMWCETPVPIVRYIDPRHG